MLPIIVAAQRRNGKIRTVWPRPTRLLPISGGRKIDIDGDSAEVQLGAIPFSARLAAVTCSILKYSP